MSNSNNMHSAFSGVEEINETGQIGQTGQINNNSSSFPNNPYSSIQINSDLVTNAAYTSTGISLDPNVHLTGGSYNTSQPYNSSQVGVIGQNIDPTKMIVKGVPECTKCGGSGFKTSKKTVEKQKPCKLCAKVMGICPKCNNTGMKLKNGKPCKCKSEEKDKKDKKDKKGKKD